MNTSWLRLMLVLTIPFGVACGAWAKPRNRGKKVARLPLAVRQMMPRGALSLRLFRLAPAPHATPFLVHLWTTPRRASVKQIRQGYKVDVPINSPFVMDVFSNGKTTVYQGTLIYASDRAPDEIKLRYRDVKEKIGLVFEVEDQRFNSSSYYHVTNTIFIVPFYLGNTYSDHTFESTSGSGASDVYYLARGANQELQIIHFTDGQGGQTKEVTMWDNDKEQFVPTQQKAALK